MASGELQRHNQQSAKPASLCVGGLPPKERKKERDGSSPGPRPRANTRAGPYEIWLGMCGEANFGADIVLVNFGHPNGSVVQESERDGAYVALPLAGRPCARHRWPPRFAHHGLRSVRPPRSDLIFQLSMPNISFRGRSKMGGSSRRPKWTKTVPIR